MRVDEGHVIHVEGPCQACEEGRDEKREKFIFCGVDAHRLCSVLVFTNGHKIISPLGIDHPVDDVKTDRCQGQGHVIVKDLASDWNDQDAHRPIGERDPVGSHQSKDLSEGEHG